MAHITASRHFPMVMSKEMQGMWHSVSVQNQKHLIHQNLLLVEPFLFHRKSNMSVISCFSCFHTFGSFCMFTASRILSVLRLVIPIMMEVNVQADMTNERRQTKRPFRLSSHLYQ